MNKLLNEILKFRKERDWEQFHNPKDLAISLTLEASELLEKFQWKSSEESIEKDLEGIKDELADVMIYALLISHDLNIDINKAIHEKIKKNNEKYPINKAKGSNKKYTEL